MKITQEIKERIYLAYVGQLCVYVGKGKPFKKTGDNPVLAVDNLELLAYSNDRSLLLNPIIKISDSDAIAVAKFFYKMPEHLLIEHGRALCFYHFVIETNEKMGRISMNLINRVSALTGADILRVAQFLQMRGYAMPYLDYSVNDLVELGIYKLK